MKLKLILSAISLAFALSVFAQTDNGSSTGSAVTRRRPGTERGTQAKTEGAAASARLQNRLQTSEVPESEMQWMRVMYRELDLTKDQNGALYYPDEPVEGQDNLFRIILKNMADGRLQAYEYLDGREVFSDNYKVKMGDILDRFYILNTPAKGSTEKNPRYEIEEADIPASEVLSYYIIERWEFDRRSNRMRTVVEAICPVLHRAGDFGGEAVRYPMFWVRYDDLRPFITTQTIFTDDDNNLATATYDDFFNLGLYKGDIYKTRNLRNRSLMQMHPDPDELAHARDSIQDRLDNYEKKLWVPSLEELKARREAAEAAETAAAEGSETLSGDTEAPAVEKAEEKTSVRKTTRTRRGSAGAAKAKAKPSKKTKVRNAKAPKSSSGSSSAPRSERNRK
ncbi:MAG: gliding motility protein GldN, partial [Duncaniella sp.]|nr:gliding motility protein GldN [Duncaniella sp.]